ncbi:MAG: bifunctional riboflavin kinase/FAD synthetase [Gammaproteobacteria bacterium]|nr:bifunctional riboflavin kinase/FAD synthetase [Gammaproteobacteria bacterium]
MQPFDGEGAAVRVEFVRGKANLRPDHRGCAVTIGNFDGVHLGHQALILRTIEVADRRGLVPTAVVFEPHPRERLAAQSVPRRVQTLRGKLVLLQRAGIRRVLCLRFDRAQARQPAAAFVSEVLLDGLGAGAVVVGEDFVFGADRGGDVALLRRLCTSAGSAVETLAAVQMDGCRVSSTVLRTALEQPDLAGAARLLGQPYRVFGRVRHGLKLGRRLGMPTANLPLHRPLALADGVYAVRTRWSAAQGWRNGVASLGIRPTLGLSASVLEVHLFDDPGKLYGENLEIEFAAFLRPQQRFDGLSALQRQMHADAQVARQYLGCSVPISR